MMCSSGRESFFNLNSTWYDPAGSWLDTRRTPLHYAYGSGCAARCNCGGDSCQGGHDYRHYGYRRSVCSKRCRSSSAPCHGKGSSQRARTSACNYRSSGRCLSDKRAVCAEWCQQPLGSCHGNRDSVCIMQPVGYRGSAGGWQDGVRACSLGCQGYGCVGGPTYSYGAYEGCHSHGAAICSKGCQGYGCVGGPTYSYGAYEGCHSHGAAICSNGCQRFYGGCHN
uniref:Uncharacterized protein n=1 Tax=Apteryx owenii TaxID=8824 RepID=A0A8B9QL27_APTOW